MPRLERLPFSEFLMENQMGWRGGLGRVKRPSTQIRAKDYMIVNNLPPSMAEISKEMLASVKQSQISFQSIWRKNVRRSLQIRNKFRKCYFEETLILLQQKKKILEKICKFLDEEFVSGKIM